MRTAGFVRLRSLKDVLSPRFQQPHVLRTLSTNALKSDAPSGDKEDDTPPPCESVDDFERRIFGESFRGTNKMEAFFKKLDSIGKGRDSFGPDMTGGGRRVNPSSSLDGLDQSFNTLQDGMDGRLEKAATYFEFDPVEVAQEDYSFRPDTSFKPGMTYNVKDLDLTKPTYRRPAQKFEFNVTTEEVLRKADFRNVRFLANFLTEAGVIKKRSQTRISAKAQRKVAREIKTARAFGLMPFTTMGTKSFLFGNSMEDSREDYEFETFDDSGDTVHDVEDRVRDLTNV